jgi:hypothetical protein
MSEKRNPLEEFLVQTSPEKLSENLGKYISGNPSTLKINGSDYVKMSVVDGLNSDISGLKDGLIFLQNHEQLHPDLKRFIARYLSTFDKS